MKAGLLGYAQANMDALQNWFFWTWKIGNSTEMGYPTSPMWHYKLGWQEGWIPNDPRVAGGYCAGIGIGGDQVSGAIYAMTLNSFLRFLNPVLLPSPPMLLPGCHRFHIYRTIGLRSRSEYS